MPTEHKHTMALWASRVNQPVFYCLDDECAFELDCAAGTTLLTEQVALVAERDALLEALRLAEQAIEPLMGGCSCVEPDVLPTIRAAIRKVQP